MVDLNNLCGCGQLFGTYYTPKIVGIEDRRVKITWMALIGAIFIFCFATMIMNHRYCEIVSLLDSNIQNSYWWEAETWVQSNNVADFFKAEIPYCNGTLNTDYIYSNKWRYVNNTCVWDFEEKHVSSKAENGLVASSSFGVVNATTGIQDSVLIIPNIEYLDFVYGLSVTIQDIETTPEYYLKKPGQDFEKISEENESGSRLRFNVKDLLADAGFTMDSINQASPANRNELPPEYSYLSGVDPIYRITGVGITFEIESSNYKFAESGWFDDTPRAQISVNVGDNNEDVTWNCKGWKLMDYEMDGSPVFSGYSCDVEIHFAVTGDYCFPNSWNVVNGFIELTVLFSIASFVVDKIFSMSLRTFKSAKVTSSTLEFANKKRALKLIKKEGADQILQEIEAGLSTMIRQDPDDASPRRRKQGYGLRVCDHDTYETFRSDSDISDLEDEFIEGNSGVQMTRSNWDANRSRLNLHLGEHSYHDDNAGDISETVSDKGRIVC